MNLFTKYGIKEVADVTFYSITKVGDEEIYTPVLLLDSLKISNLSKTAEKVNAEGGKGNKRLITWNFGKQISLKLQDALFSPASMSMIWGGRLEAQLSPYTSVIVKLNMANKYGKLNYSTKAYPSPALTKEEWEIVFKAATECKVKNSQEEDSNIYWVEYYNKDIAYIEENRTELRKRYFHRNWYSEYLAQLKAICKEEAAPEEYKETYLEWLYTQQAMPELIINKIISYIDELKKVGTIETEIYETEVIDRMEKVIVKNKEGLIISTKEQKKNLLKYYRDDKDCTFSIYYDAKTMLPLLNITEDGIIKGWDKNENYDVDFDGEIDDERFRLRIGSICYKWTRTVRKKDESDDGILGRTFVINADTFPDAYKIVGETVIRDQKTQKDHTYSFVIHRAVVSANTDITLQADGEPTVFDLDIDVLTPDNDIQMELKLFDTEEDYLNGGTRIVPQRNEYSYTAVDEIKENKIDFTNEEYI